MKFLTFISTFLSAILTLGGSIGGLALLISFILFGNFGYHYKVVYHNATFHTNTLFKVFLIKVLHKNLGKCEVVSEQEQR